MPVPKNSSLPGFSPPTRRLRWSLLLALACILAAGTVVLAQSGAVYDLHWNVLTGGGNLASGAAYRVHYSYGQPSTVSYSTGTTYQVGQGFWLGDPVPTAVKLVAFAAAPAGPGVLVTWETASEHDNLGFHLYRQAGSNAPLVRLNDTLIPSRSPGGDVGASYTFYDPTGQDGTAYLYTLEDVNTSGLRTPHGPVEGIAPYAAFLPLVRR
jgi:hypothetical protein